MAAETPARQGDSRVIDARQCQGEVDHGANDRLPIRAHKYAVLDEHASLTGSVEREDMIAAALRGCRASIVHGLNGLVISVGADQKWAQARAAGIEPAGPGEAAGWHGERL